MFAANWSLPAFSLGEGEKPSASIVGCRELVGGSGYRKDLKSLKFITESCETWIAYEVKTKEPKEGAGGAYRLTGGATHNSV